MFHFCLPSSFDIIYSPEGTKLGDRCEDTQPNVSPPKLRGIQNFVHRWCCSQPIIHKNTSIWSLSFTSKTPIKQNKNKTLSEHTFGWPQTNTHTPTQICLHLKLITSTCIETIKLRFCFCSHSLVELPLKFSIICSP